MKGGESQHFDVLAVDAFSGDSIPMHLLTEECFGIYLAHLNEDGILAFHISNKTINLAPVVFGLAKAYHMQARVFKAADNEKTATLASSWILVSNNAGFWNDAEVMKKMDPVSALGNPILWTDDFSSLLQVLR